MISRLGFSLKKRSLMCDSKDKFNAEFINYYANYRFIWFYAAVTFVFPTTQHLLPAKWIESLLLDCLLTPTPSLSQKHVCTDLMDFVLPGQSLVLEFAPTRWTVISSNGDSCFFRHTSWWEQSLTKAPVVSFCHCKVCFINGAYWGWSPGTVGLRKSMSIWEKKKQKKQFLIIWYSGFTCMAAARERRKKRKHQVVKITLIG